MICLSRTTTLSNFWRSIKWSLLDGTPLSHVSIGASADQLAAGHAPRVVLRATHEGALDYCSLTDLKRFALDLA